MRRVTVFFSALALLGALAVTATADDKRPDAARADDRRADDTHAVVVKTPDLLGKAVKNKANEHLGYLEDLVVEVSGGKVAYAVLTYKDAVGFGGKMFALPLNAFTLSEDLRYLVVDASKNDFENKEGFDANRWPTKVDEHWSTKFQKGRTGTGSDRPAAAAPERPVAAADRAGGDRDSGKDNMLRRLTSLNGLYVKNDRGEDLGKIQGFAIDTTHGKIVYAAMAYGGVAGVGSKLFAIPWEAMKLESPNLRVQDRCFAVHATKADFENSPGFDRNMWPVKGDTRFMMKDGKGGSSGADRR